MSTNKQRREALILEMEGLGQRGINCQGCQGTCCTSLANSMQISPIEALDMLTFLKSKDRLTPDLKNKLIECVEKYRLDYEISTTRGVPLRRTYTCPFFEPGPKGCTIDKYYKPYGCLAFNPQEKNATGGASCFSKREILIKRSEEFEQSENEIIKDYKINWTKKNIPSALLDLWPIFN